MLKRVITSNVRRISKSSHHVPLNFLSSQSNVTKPIEPQQKQQWKCVYDGSCPVCSLTVDATLDTKKVDLVDAREGGELVKKLRAQGINLDKGMAMVNTDTGEVLHGDKALQMMGTVQNNALLQALFDNSVARKMAPVVYPYMVRFRNLVLKLLDIGSIEETLSEKNAKKLMSQSLLDKDSKAQLSDPLTKTTESSESVSDEKNAYRP